jgi:hypothetical protein
MDEEDMASFRPYVEQVLATPPAEEFELYKGGGSPQAGVGDLIKSMFTGGLGKSKGTGGGAVMTPDKILWHRQKAKEAIESGKADARKVSAMFKQETGEDL